MSAGSPPSRLDSIREPVRQECEALENYFKTYLRTDVSLIDRVFEHLIDGGGKRFRPLLVLLVSSCSPNRLQESVYKLAVAVEFIHTATLLHDDVVDQSDVRRGNRVAYRIWGAEPSVLSGDYLYSRAFNLLVEIGHLGILDSLSDATTQMARGEVLQLLRSYSPSTTREEYIEVIRGKTASLISASCISAGYLAGFEGEDLQAVGGYGLNLGLAFQIVDDILDYTAERGMLGKAIGKDFMEGKVTLPVIVLMEALDPESRTRLAEIFLKDGPEPEDFETVLALLVKHGTLETTLGIAAGYRDLALHSLAAAPAGPCRDSLQVLANYVLERSL
ncbi:MAG: polyprenyl synthetase family protein [bacterium]|nr:polyprenyl synthetase family protein [bacterium]